jgi:hypothetical protein
MFASRAAFTPGSDLMAPRKQFPAGNVTAEPLPESVAMGATRIVMHQIVAPSEVDALGICFGGQVSITGAMRDQM